VNVLALVIATLILPTHTPGARYSKVTQGTIKTTICVKGWTATIRPPSSYTSALKRVQLVVWQYADTNQAHYEEDHLISLELGGAPPRSARRRICGRSPGRRPAGKTTGSRPASTGGSATAR
jgi:hypothetical protein